MSRLERQLVEVLRARLAGRAPLVPEAGRTAWQWFADLCATRTVGPLGPNPVSFAEIEAYSRLMGLPLAPHHVQLLRALDRAWLACTRGGTAPAARDAQPMNPAAFDAVFG